MKTLNDEQNSCFMHCKLLFRKTQNEQNSLIKSVLVSNKAEGYMDMMITILCMSLVLIVIINIFGFLKIRNDIDYIAGELVKISTVKGKINDDDITLRLQELINDTSLAVSYEITGDCFSNDKVQYGNTIKATLSYDAEFTGMGVVPITIPIRVSRSGISQMYWKE